MTIFLAENEIHIKLQNSFKEDIKYFESIFRTQDHILSNLKTKKINNNIHKSGKEIESLKFWPGGFVGFAKANPLVLTGGV